MISSVLALLAAATAAQSDTTRSAREAFTACLRGYVDRSLDAGLPLATFQSEYPQQCSTEEAAFRAAVIRRETSARASRADAEEAANLEIEDARVNFSERFELATPADSTPETPETPPPSQPEATPTAQAEPPQPPQ
jgi:hypothetical protein